MRREPRQDGLLLLLRLLALDGELGLELGAILGGLRVRQLEVGPVLEGAFVQARLSRRRLRLALGLFLVQARDHPRRAPRRPPEARGCAAPAFR